MPLAPALAQEKVGVASAVNQGATSTPPGAPTRSLVVGTDVVYNEKIATEATGQAQLIFLDRSAFTVGPSSEVVIDEFVYDPKAGTGKIVASAAKGVFRFVGGAISKNEGGVTVKTPTATIGIRGAIALVAVDGVSHEVQATLVHGVNLALTAPGGQQVLVTRPGFTTTFSPATGRFSPPAPATNIAQQMSGLDGRKGSSGGAAQPPSDARVQQSNLSAVNSSNVATSVADATRAQPVGAAVPPPPPPPSNPSPSQNELVASTTTAPLTQSPSPGVAPAGAASPSTPPQSGFIQLSGYVAGAVTDMASSTPQIYAGASGTPSDFVLTTNLAANVFSAVANIRTVTGGPVSTLVFATDPASPSVGILLPGFVVSGALAGTTIDGLAATSNATNAVGTLAAGTSLPAFGTIVGGAGNGSVFRLHNLFWVAGDLAPLGAAFPTTGTASYSGIAVGVALSSSGGPITVSPFSGTSQLTFNFGTRSGVFAANFSAFFQPVGSSIPVALSGTVTTSGANLRDFGGGLVTTGTFGASGNLAGSFFRTGGPTGDPAGAAGGHFTASGSVLSQPASLAGVFGMSK